LTAGKKRVTFWQDTSSKIFSLRKEVMARETSRSRSQQKYSAPMDTPRSSYGTTYNNMNMNESPYSFSSMLSFINNNAGLIFIALAIFIVGFLGGSLWTENKIYKKGGLGTTVAQAPTGAAAPQQAAPDAPAGPLSDDDWKSIQENNPAGIIGDKNAKVTMVEFTDYQCPFCSQFFNTSFAQLKKDYIDTGKVKIIVRDQPLPFHPNARIGALAARCAADQGGLLGGNKTKNYEYMHEALFKNQDTWVNLAKDAAITKFGELAQAGGMDANKMKDCVTTEKFGKEVDADSALGTKVGANGTPTFFIEKEILVGAQPTSSFTAALDKALGK
jgi:protein-disulfide isomerase